MRHAAAAGVAILFAASQAAAGEEARGLGAHEHGLGTLSLALEDDLVAIEFEAPGADIVGFEHKPGDDAERAAVAKALADLEAPLTLFALNNEAGCQVVQAKAELVQDDHDDDGHDDHDHEKHAEDGHDDHDHEKHAEDGHDDHDHEKHAEEGHDDHDHDKHAEDGHDDHDHDKHAEDGHDDHDHDKHAEHDHEAEHSEFRASYQLRCAQPNALASIDLPFFERFPTSERLTVTVIGGAGARRFDADRDNDSVDISSAIN